MGTFKRNYLKRYMTYFLIKVKYREACWPFMASTRESGLSCLGSSPGQAALHCVTFFIHPGI